MNVAKSLSLAAALMILSTPVFAGTYAYQCEIVEVSFLRESGKLEQATGPLSPVGKRFAVDRKSGAMVGGDLFASGDPKVLSKGNSDNGFVVLWLDPARNGGVHLTTLHVTEYEPLPKKSFMYTSAGSMVVSGVCE